MYDLSNHQKQIGIETLRDCCWTRSIQNLSCYWQQHFRQPEISSNCLSLLHYNIRHFYSNQVELVDIVNAFAPTIISLNELGTNVPKKSQECMVYSSQLR
jgi:hypothetical protein